MAGLGDGDALPSAKGPPPSAPAGCGLRGGDGGEATKSPGSRLIHLGFGGAARSSEVPTPQSH